MGSGTSPRMRGKRHRTPGGRPSRRNIPAYAGKTRSWMAFCAGLPEHPRVCGENGTTAHRPNRIQGTSPRMRGKLWVDLADMRLDRNIPAYAGKTFPVSHKTSTTPEHPRVCGENPRNNWSLRSVSGTSPRMRGKLILELTNFLPRRNIPAYAGKTTLEDMSLDAYEEHPRVCGENGRRFKPSSPLAGTSPRMRGKL